MMYFPGLTTYFFCLAKILKSLTLINKLSNLFNNCGVDVLVFIYNTSKSLWNLVFDLNITLYTKYENIAEIKIPLITIAKKTRLMYINYSLKNCN